MRQNGGFTLIELMVAVSLVSVVILSLLTVFTSFIRQQVFSQDERNALNSVRFLIADVSRDVSFGTDYVCGERSGGDCVCMTLTDQLNRRVKIRHNGANNRVEKSVQVVDANPGRCLNGDPWVPLTDTAVDITDLSFDVNSSADPSNVKMIVKASYVVDGETKDVSFRSQVTRRVFRPDEGALSSLRVGSGADQGGSSLSYFIYDDDGNCIDDSGATVSATQCQQAASPLAVEIADSGLYLLTDSGLLFHLPIASVKTALAATAASSAFSIAENRVPIAMVQSGVVRVVGKDGSDSCRGCLNDPVNIDSIYPAGSRLYAVSREGSLYNVEGGRAELILNSTESGNEVYQFDSNNSNGSVIILYSYGGVRQLRLFTTEDIGISDLSGTCKKFVIGGSDRCMQLVPVVSQYRREAYIDLRSLNNLTPSQVSRISLSSGYVFVWHQTGGTIKMLLMGGEGSRTWSKLLSESTRSERDVVQGLVEARPRGRGLSRQDLFFACEDSKKFCNKYVYPHVITSFIDGTTRTITRQGGGVTNEDALIRFSYQSGANSRGEYDRNAVGVSESGRMVFLAEAAQTTRLPSPVYEANQRLLCGTTVRDIGSMKQQVQFFSISRVPPPLSGINGVLALLGRSIKQGGGAESEVYLLAPSPSDRSSVGYTYGTTGVLCGSDHVERYTMPVSGTNFSHEIFRLTGLQLIDIAPTP